MRVSPTLKRGYLFQGQVTTEANDLPWERERKGFIGKKDYHRAEEPATGGKFFASSDLFKSREKQDSGSGER